MPRQQIALVLKQPVFGIDAGIVESGVGRGDLQVPERAQILGGPRRDGSGRWAGRRRRGAVSCHQRRQALAVRCGEGRLTGQEIVQLGGIVLQVVKFRVRSVNVLIISPAQAAQRRPSKFVVRVGAFAVNVARRRIPALGEVQQAVAAKARRRRNSQEAQHGGRNINQPGGSFDTRQVIGRRNSKLETRNSRRFSSFEFRVSIFRSSAANGRSAARAACCGK